MKTVNESKSYLTKMIYDYQGEENVKNAYRFNWILPMACRTIFVTHQLHIGKVPIQVSDVGDQKMMYKRTDVSKYHVGF